MRHEDVRHKVSQTMKERGCCPTVRGGNGHGMTGPERRLSDATGLFPHVIAVGRIDGYPSNYKLDLANPQIRLAVEIDGGSHGTLKVQDADARKTDYLESHGWTVLRFTNAEVLGDTDRCAQMVASTTSKLKASTPT